MLRVIKLLLYYFLSQLCATCIALALYFAYQYFETGSFLSNFGLPLSFSLTANIASILFMVWILVKDKYITLNKKTVAFGKPINVTIYSLIGITAMIWLNFLSDIAALPDWFKSTFSLMQESMVGIITMAIIAPIFEEMLFRGAIEGHLLNKWRNPRYAILVSALIFGLVHINPAQMLFAFLFGLILGEVYYRTKSITPGIILHFINNTTSVIIMLLFPEYNTLTDLLGLKDMTIISAISLILFIILMRVFMKRYPQKSLSEEKI